jgi:hypothetical protein
MKKGPKAKGTRGQLFGKKAGTSKGRGRGTSSGRVKKTPPEENVKSLEKQGIDKELKRIPIIWKHSLHA